MARLEISADLAGTVFKVELQAGASVDDSTPILVLESMKMEIPVTSPRPGRLVEVLVNEGDTVSEGQPLATVEL